MTQDSHRIRLRGPWNVQKSARERPCEVKVFHFPETWGAISRRECGTYHFLRRFGSPTGVGPLQTVWLEVKSGAAGRATLNEDELGVITPGSQSFDVTSRLRDGNQLNLELRRTEDINSADVIAEVAIVIETRGEPLTLPQHDISPSP
jgi:hypothetical protein